MEPEIASSSTEAEAGMIKRGTFSSKKETRRPT
jgi:hypothetical protein